MDDTTTLQLPRTRTRRDHRRGANPLERPEPHATKREITGTIAAFVGLFLLAWIGSVVIQAL